ncbi:biotin--protein ligase isoform X2 [Anoplophora glabripennis]|nr:biotin--protein ligase isoform X2 [Anoplophora glabripennis]
MLESYMRHSAASLQVENFGELVAWKVTDYFEAILKTDIDKLTKLVHCYSQSPVDINHELKLLKIETVDIEGVAAKIRYERKFPKDNILKYSYAPVHWKKFVESLKEIYAKLRDSTNPKIMIENGAAKSEDVKKVPVSEVKPIKKDNKKSEDKNTLEVGSSDFRRHKSGDHKREKIAAKSDASKIEKSPEQKHKDGKIGKTEKETKKDEKEKHRKKDEEVKKDSKDGPKPTKEHVEAKKMKASGKTHKKDRDPTKLERARSKADLEVAGKSTEKPPEQRTKDKGITKRTTSSEKKLVKSVAVCEDGDVKEKSETKDPAGKTKEKLRNGDANGHHAAHNGSLFTKYKGVKPPNILVYADSVVAKENVKGVLSTMLNKEKYTIYDLPMTPNQTVWNGSTVLVVVCGTVPPSLTFHLLQYLLSGGQLLCLCSDLLYSVLHTFTTAEVREHELVRFTYGKWRQVRMMHHIFCYQASPAKKQFSKDSDHSNQSSGNGSSPIAPRTPSAVEIQHNGKDYTIQVQVLGTEETWQTPSLLLATVKDGEGRAIFSQVHLEIDPNEYEDDENKFAALKDSDQARMEILRDILSNHLDVDCTLAADIAYTPAYFLGRHDLKLGLLSDCEHIKENTLVSDKLTVKFCGKDEKADAPSSSFLPVFIHSCPSNFSTVNYFEALETEQIGRLVLYCDVLGSSQTVLSKTLTHGLVVIPRQQTQGIGRSNNVWISPIGSANFSLQLHIPTASPLYKYLPLTQQIVMVGVVHALKKFNGCQDLKIGIKWPNDLYANGNVKIGGLLATSFVNEDVAVINIGCGINLDNSNPTTCVNDLIREASPESANTIHYEAYFAAVFNETEKLLNSYQKGDPDAFFDLYYKYWLHNNSVVTITAKEGERKKARVVGIDEFGFLKVRSDEGAIVSVQPDGNAFDMLEGLISPKAF